jgi:hypothetical protein
LKEEAKDKHEADGIAQKPGDQQEQATEEEESE